MGNNTSKINEQQLIEKLSKSTSIDRMKLQKLYNNFNRQYPSSRIDYGMFVQLYTKFFPFYESLTFVNYIFNIYDKDNKGYIDFEDYCFNYNILVNGTSEDKLRWLFRLYDVNKTKKITKEDFFTVSKANYQLTGDLMDKSKFHDLDKHLIDKIEAIFRDANSNEMNETQFIKIASFDSYLVKALDTCVGII